MQIQFQTPVHPKYRWDASYETPYPTKEGRHRYCVPLHDFYNTHTQSFTFVYDDMKDRLSPNEMVYCRDCARGCRFKNIEKHCSSKGHLAILYDRDY